MVQVDTSRLHVRLGREDLVVDWEVERSGDVVAKLSLFLTGEVAVDRPAVHSAAEEQIEEIAGDDVVAAAAVVDAN